MWWDNENKTIKYKISFEMIGNLVKEIRRRQQKSLQQKSLQELIRR